MTDDQTRERSKWRINREVSAGDLVATIIGPGRAAEILGAPITEEEAWQG